MGKKERITGDPLVCCEHVRMVDPRKLRPHPHNPNTHTKAQIQMLAKIISKQGWRAPIVTSKRSGLIVAGHLRHAAALFIGCAMVPVNEQDFSTDEAEIAHMLADNAIAELSEINMTKRGSLLSDLRLKDFDLSLAGFDAVQLDVDSAALLNNSGAPTAQDPVARLLIPPRVWLTQSGDVKQAVTSVVSDFGIEVQWPE